MDFPLMFAMQKAFDEKDGWDTGLARLYEILAHDFVYPYPDKLFVFADNHDIGRFQRDSSLALGRLKLAMHFFLPLAVSHKYTTVPKSSCRAMMLKGMAIYAAISQVAGHPIPNRLLPPRAEPKNKMKYGTTWLPS